MAAPSIDVRIPTILRSHTGGEKVVAGSGDTLGRLIDDLDSRYAGLGGRVVNDGQLARFVNVYVNDEDVRFLGGLETELSEGDSVTILPAVAGGAAGHRSASHASASHASVGHRPGG